MMGDGGTMSPSVRVRDQTLDELAFCKASGCVRKHVADLLLTCNSLVDLKVDVD